MSSYDDCFIIPRSLVCMVPDTNYFELTENSGNHFISIENINIFHFSLLVKLK